MTLTSYSIADIVTGAAPPAGFYINRMENIPRPAGIVFPHTHRFYEVLWIQEGASKQLIDYNAFTVTQGCLFFISPGQTHLFEEWSKVKGVAIFFTEDFFITHYPDGNLLFELSFLDNLYAAPAVALTPEQAGALAAVEALLTEEYTAPGNSPENVAALLAVFLRKIQRFYAAATASVYPPTTSPSSKNCAG